MNLPSSNNLWTLFLTGGILIMIFSFSELEEIRSKYNEYIISLEKSKEIKTQLNKSLENYRNQLRLDFKDLIKIHKNIELADSLTKNTNSLTDTVRINRLLAENNMRKFESNKSKKDLKTLYELAEDDESIDKLNSAKRKQIEFLEENKKDYFFLLILGAALAILGFFKLMVNQRTTDKILIHQYLNSEVKYLKCQSCGMKLEFDDNFDKKSNYCSFCYSNGAFNHELSEKEFKVLIDGKLKEIGFSKVQRLLFLWKVSSLERWQIEFTWNK
ncbi:MAG: hypothetical protein GY834_06220 [Bacteroidetes bacterium]|nr:hypothetical protein [Bacteroidota bacterium]